MMPTNGRSCGECAEEIEDEIPARIDVAADVGVGNGQHRDEFDDFIERAKAHSRSGSESQQAITRKNGRFAARSKVLAQTVPADPSGDAESIGMDQLIILEPRGDEPEAVKHRLAVTDEPVRRDRPESARHVSESPNAESPQLRELQRHAAVDQQHHGNQNQHGDDVKNKFAIASDKGTDEGHHQISPREDRQWSERCLGMGHVFTALTHARKDSAHGRAWQTHSICAFNEKNRSYSEIFVIFSELWLF